MITLNHLRNICKMSQEELLEYLPLQLTAYGYAEPVCTGDYIYAAGTIPVLLVAHLDTIFRKLPEFIFHDQLENVMWSPEGLGADDRVGVYAILRIIETGLKPHILFTTLEEKGCVGAIIAASELKPDVNFVIALDLKGSDCAVCRELYNKKFINYIEGIGYKYQKTRGYSDVDELCPVWDIAGVNISIGYYKPHTISEYVRLNETEDTIRRVIRVLVEVPNYDFHFYSRD